MTSPRLWFGRLGLPVVAALPVVSCLGASTTQIISNRSLDCSIPQSLIFDGGPGKDGIPALSNPTLVNPGAPGTEYLRDTDRVIGLLVDDQPIAVPLNIGWWHEIVNFDLGGRHLAVTHCPLTGSSLVFDRGSARNATFGVSGLLLMNNLIMYDRNAGESFWPQLSRGARCGPATGTNLAMLPAIEMTWDGWKTLYPSTRVVSAATGFGRDYTQYPYGDYDRPDNPRLLFPNPSLDRRRPPKERVLGIPAGDSAGVAFPFGVLDSLGSVTVVEATVAGERVAVFWDGARGGAAAFHPRAGETALTFRAEANQIVDNQSGSAWRVDGVATSGPLAGTRLEPVAQAFVVYWFAWAGFYPAAQLWTGQGAF